MEAEEWVEHSARSKVEREEAEELLEGKLGMVATFGMQINKTV